MQHQLSPGLAQKIIDFFEEHPPLRLSRNLRRVLLDFLRIELKTHVPLFTNDLLWDLYDFFELLDTAAIETKDWYATQHHPAQDLYANVTLDEEQDEISKVESNPGEDVKDASANNEKLWGTLRNFFSIWHLQDIETDLWEMLKRSLTNEGDETPASERDNMINMYEQLKLLLQALFQWYRQYNLIQKEEV